VAGRIREEDIALVRERARIDEIVREYVTLRNAGGGSLKGLCPFHDEKTPSFNVAPARGTFHCFGCGEGGDVISFLQKVDHLSFVEGVERLADKVGIALRYEDTGHGSAPSRNREQRSRLIEAHRVAAEFYAGQLTGPEAAPGRHFLTDRGFDRDIAARFGVGYAPRDGESLLRHLRARGVTDADAIASGLVGQGRNGPYDRFRGRLVWPLRDLLGDVVGFGARRLFDDDRIEAKYLNTPETLIYKKSQVLYGIDLAKKDIAKSRQAVVVEGYTDVMACHVSGVTTAVATCGTAFGDEHARILRRLLMDQDEFRGEVVFTFDGDAAGQKAALKAFEGDQRFVSQTFVAVEPNGMDPCELRQAKGDDAVRELVAGRQRLFEFAIRSMLSGYDLDAAEDRVQAVDKAIPVVARIRDTALRDEYARRLAGWVGAADELAIVRRARAAARGTPAGGPASTRPPAPERAPLDGSARSAPSLPNPFNGHGSVDPAVLTMEREGLKCALQRPDLAGPLFDGLAVEAFVSPVHRVVKQAIAAAGGCASASPDVTWVEAVSAPPPDEGYRRLVSAFAVDPVPSSDEALPRYVSEVVLRLHEQSVARQVAAVKGRLQRTDPAAQPDEYKRLRRELTGLEARRRDLRERALGTV